MIPNICFSALDFIIFKSYILHIIAMDSPKSLSLSIVSFQKKSNPNFGITIIEDSMRIFFLAFYVDSFVSSVHVLQTIKIGNAYKSIQSEFYVSRDVSQ